MGLLKKIFSKRFIGILLAVVVLFNVISPDIIMPKAYALEIAGILLMPLTFLVVTLAELAIGIVSLIAGSGSGRVFVSDIVYNQLDVFKVNIFGSLPTAAAMQGMLPTIQKWYVITRSIAIAASFVILVYVAIKIFR